MGPGEARRLVSGAPSVNAGVDRFGSRQCGLAGPASREGQTPDDEVAGGPFDPGCPGLGSPAATRRPAAHRATRGAAALGSRLARGGPALRRCATLRGATLGSGAALRGRPLLRRARAVARHGCVGALEHPTQRCVESRVLWVVARNVGRELHPAPLAGRGLPLLGGDADLHVVVLPTGFQCRPFRTKLARALAIPLDLRAKVTGIDGTRL